LLDKAGDCFDRVLSKPITQEDLLAAISELLGTSMQKRPLIQPDLKEFRQESWRLLVLAESALARTDTQSVRQWLHQLKGVVSHLQPNESIIKVLKDVESVLANDRDFTPVLQEIRMKMTEADWKD